MSCELWADKLDAYVDNEGSRDDFSAMEDHMRACPDCARDALGRIQLKRATQAAAMRYTPPPEFRLRVQKSIQKDRKPLWALAWKPALLAATAMILLVVASALVFTRHVESDRAIVAQGEDVDRRRHRRLDARQLGHDLVDGIDDVGAGLLVDDQEHGALAVGPGRLRRILRSFDRLADVADTQRSAVAVGDDDVVPGLGLGELIVGVDRERAVAAVDRCPWDRRRSRSRAACEPPPATDSSPRVWPDRAGCGWRASAGRRS